jgi:hypothetical protein
MSWIKTARMMRQNSARRLLSLAQRSSRSQLSAKLVTFCSVVRAQREISQNMGGRMTPRPRQAALHDALGMSVASDAPQFHRLRIKGVEIVICWRRSMKPRSCARQTGAFINGGVQLVSAGLSR